MKTFKIAITNIWTDNKFYLVKQFPSVYFADVYASRLFIKASRKKSPYTVSLVIE